jgi:predicted amidohydrolase
MTAPRFRVAAVQTVSSSEVADNLRSIEPLVAEAVREGAQLVLLPEYFGILGARSSDKVAVREADGAGPQQDFLERMAREHGAWIIGGTVPISTNDAARVRSASLVYAPGGRRVARYDKIHLFSFNQGDERYDEGRTIEAGASPVTFNAPCGRVALSVCYDLRFPELYRSFDDLVLIVVPSAFTVVTGAAHWHVLLKARAIENQCYVLAAAQGGLHANGRRTYGHSVLIDPWGVVLVERDEGPGVIVGDIDPERIAQVRRELPALSHRRLR